MWAWKVKTHKVDLSKYVKAGISLRGGQCRWGTFQGDHLCQTEGLALRETDVTQDMRSWPKSDPVQAQRSGPKGGSQQPPIVTICWDMTLVTARSEELHVCYKRARPLLNHSQRWVAETGRNNRCQSSLNGICHLSKFQIIPLLRRKMKAKMLPEFDILINYFLHMRNWLILHVTLEPSCVLNCKMSKESSL